MQRSNWEVIYHYRASAMSTNIGNVLQRCENELLGSYKDPITSFSRLYHLSVENPEVTFQL
jgi:hypothetical protein